MRIKWHRQKNNDNGGGEQKRRFWSKRNKNYRATVLNNMLNFFPKSFGVNEINAKNNI